MIRIEFNQPLQIPKEFQKKKRMLNLAGDQIFEISVGNKIGERHDFNHSIVNFEADYVEVQLDFDNPISISQN